MYFYQDGIKKGVVFVFRKACASASCTSWIASFHLLVNSFLVIFSKMQFVCFLKDLEEDSFLPWTKQSYSTNFASDDF